jgi:outer membrane lipoprotein LolB
MHRLRAAPPRSTWLQTIALLAVGTLAGCAPSALERPSGQAAPLVARETFEAAGRLSARHGAEALAANFQWRHTADRDEIELITPLGQTIAQLTGDDTSVRLQAADGRILTANNWSALTERGLGWPLPVDGLKYWMQGSARSGAPFTSEPGDDGRPSVLRQDGWTIVYQTYAEAPAGVWRPSRLTATYPEVELRLAIDRWQ